MKLTMACKTPSRNN